MAMSIVRNTSALRDSLMCGKREFLARFDKTSPVSLRAGETFPPATGQRSRVYQLQAGWACQYEELRADRRAIIDVYLPGDFIGLDGMLKTRSVENVLALTSIETASVDARDLLSEVIGSPSAALFAGWLLSHRQKHADRLLATISGCDARGRLAEMLLDLYLRLRARKLITTNTFNLPLTQQHIGEYLGLTVVHVNRILKSLRIDRIASMEKHCVTILDMQRLVLLSRNPVPADASESAGRARLRSPGMRRSTPRRPVPCSYNTDAFARTSGAEQQDAGPASPNPVAGPRKPTPAVLAEQGEPGR